jgi:hypothetical protein
MPFPDVISTSAAQASAKLGNTALVNGQTNLVPLDRLTFLEEVVGNLMTSLPPQGGTGLGGALSLATLTPKRISAIADAVATTVLTITCPNVLASAMVRVTIVGIAGAGGAIGAGEDVTTVSYDIAVTRTPGVAVGATISSAYGSAAAVVVGAGTMTCVAALTLTGEGVTLTNTVTVKATIDQSSTSTNHTAIVYAQVINNLAGGITIA